MNQILIAALILAIVSPVVAAPPKTIYQRQQEANQRSAQAAKSAKKGRQSARPRSRSTNMKVREMPHLQTPPSLVPWWLTGRKSNPLTGPKTDRDIQMSREQVAAGFLLRPRHRGRHVFGR